MNTRAIILDGTSQQLSAVLGGSEFCSSVTIENITGNSVMFWGSKENQLMTLAAGTKISLPVTSLKNVWVKGTNTDVINIAVFG